MAATARSLFAPFDLSSYDSLLRLHPGLWICLGGCADLSYSGIKYTEEKEAATKATVARMKKSPLFHEITKFFMDLPIYSAPHLVAVGQQLLEFATRDAQDPALPGYQNAVKAWEEREFKLTKDFTDDEESSGDDKSLINYNYRPHEPPHPVVEPQQPSARKIKAITKTEIPDSEDEGAFADDEAELEEKKKLYYDNDGNELEGETIIIEAPSN